MITNKEIATQLKLRADKYPPEGHCVLEKEIVFRHDRFLIRCSPTREAILRVAEKYAKGISQRWFYGHDAPYGRRWGRVAQSLAARAGRAAK